MCNCGNCLNCLSPGDSLVLQDGRRLQVVSVKGRYPSLDHDITERLGRPVGSHTKTRAKTTISKINTWDTWKHVPWPKPKRERRK
jgi:hypothetical protein